MNQIDDRRETETCAKWTLGSILRSGTLRTSALLAAAAFATLLTIDLPAPGSGVADDVAAVERGAPQPYVPASDKWIELGIPQRPATPPMSNRLQAELLQRSGATASVTDPARPQSRRMPVRLHHARS